MTSSTSTCLANYLFQKKLYLFVSYFIFSILCNFILCKVLHKQLQFTILVVYVDDIAITIDDVEEIKRLKKRLIEEFEVKRHGGVEVLSHEMKLRGHKRV